MEVNGKEEIMKKNIIVVAAVCLLSAACAKEVQPQAESQGSASGGYIEVSVAQTKTLVNSQTGRCYWQKGDVLNAWFQVKAEDQTLSDSYVTFTYDEMGENGKARFLITDGQIPVTYEKVLITTPAGTFVDDGNGGKKFLLVRDYDYEPDRIPVYLRAEKLDRVDPDESVEGDEYYTTELKHNASVFTFTLHDIPAYATGFVLKSNTESQSIKITTKFPCKTGYDEDIRLSTVVPKGSVPECFYLIDIEGNEIEGSKKEFKAEEGKTLEPVGADDYVEYPTTVDFKKSELRKGYVVVCGVKWAKGNLVRDKNNKWHKAQAGIDDGFQSGWGLHDEQWKYINWDQSMNIEGETDVRYKYENDTFFDVFTWGGIGRRASYHSGRLVTDQAEFDIQAKVWWGYESEKIIDGVTVANSKSNPENLTELEGDARFSSEENSSKNTVYTKDGETKEIAGDVAFWASKGKYCLPNKTQINELSHKDNSKASIKYGKYVYDENTEIYGYLYTTPIDGDPKRNLPGTEEFTGPEEFTDADLECGLFLPLTGRRSPNGNDIVINQGDQAIYRCSQFGNPANAVNKHEQCARVLWFDTPNPPAYGFTSGKPGAVDDDGYSYTCTLSAAAGGAIRPIVYEKQ